MLKKAVLLGASLVLTGCASTASETVPGECFYVSSVRDYEIVDDDHVRVTASQNRSYILTTASSARWLDWSFAIALRAPSSRVCVGDALAVELVGGRPLRRVMVIDVQREVADAEESGSAE